MINYTRWLNDWNMNFKIFSEQNYKIMSGQILYQVTNALINA
jgi:hypothetical protein